MMELFVDVSFPLMPVSVTPWMKVRCAKKSATIGSVITVEAVISSAHSAPCWLTNRCGPIESV